MRTATTFFRRNTTTRLVPHLSNETTARWFYTKFLSDVNYLNRFIRNRPTRLRMVVNNVETVLETNAYDVLTGVHPCTTGQSFPTPPPEHYAASRPMFVSDIRSKAR